MVKDVGDSLDILEPYQWLKGGLSVTEDVGASSMLGLLDDVRPVDAFPFLHNFPHGPIYESAEERMVDRESVRVGHRGYQGAAVVKSIEKLVELSKTGWGQRQVFGPHSTVNL